MGPAPAHTLAHRLAAGTKAAWDYRQALALLVVAWVSAPHLAAMRHFWDPDVARGTGKLLAAHLFFFDVALMILMAAIVARRLTPVVFAIAFALGISPYAQSLIDVHLHDLLERAGVFLWMFGLKEGDSIVNPRSAKIVLFASLTPALMIQLLWHRTRSIDRAFVLMGTVAVALTTFLFHAALPDGVMRFARQDAGYLVRYAVMPTTPEAKSYCQFLGSRCTTVHGRAGLEAALRSQGFGRMANQLPEMPDGAIVSTTTGQTFTNEHGRAQLKPMLVAFRVPTAANQPATLLVDERQAKTIEQVHERSFALLSIAAHGFWTLFVAALCTLHQWRGRSRLFRPTQRA